MSKNKILLYGSKSTAFIIYEMLKELKKNPKYIFDPMSNKPNFNHNLIFSNKIYDFKKFISNSKYFSVCIAREDGYARYKISKNLEKLKLKPINIISKLCKLNKNSTYGRGLISMANSYVNRGGRIGDYCILNTGATVDHECIIGIMEGCYLAGRVKIGDFTSIGATATILPDINIGKNVIVGAGAVVTKNVKSNMVVVGNPARYLRNNFPKFNSKIFGKILDEKQQKN